MLLTAQCPPLLELSGSYYNYQDRNKPNCQNSHLCAFIFTKIYLCVILFRIFISVQSDDVAFNVKHWKHL